MASDAFLSIRRRSNRDSDRLLCGRFLRACVDTWLALKVHTQVGASRAPRLQWPLRHRQRCRQHRCDQPVAEFRLSQSLAVGKPDPCERDQRSLDGAHELPTSVGREAYRQVRHRCPAQGCDLGGPGCERLAHPHRMAKSRQCPRFCPQCAALQHASGVSSTSEPPLTARIWQDCDSGCRGFESHQPPQNQ